MTCVDDFSEWAQAFDLPNTEPKTLGKI